MVFGHTSGLAVIRSLGSRGVPVAVADYDERGFADASRFVRRRIRVPHPEQDEEAFVQSLLARAAELSGGLLVPGSDEALAAIARHKDRLEAEYVVGCPSWETVSRVIEKHHTYRIAESVGVPCPRTVFPGSMEDVEGFAATTAYPCLVKPSQSHLFYERFGCKMFPAADAGELVAMYRRAAQAGMDVVLQEFIPGDEASGANFNSYRWNDESLLEFTAGKVRNAPPRYGSPRVAVSRHIPELASPGRRLLAALGLNGFSCSEFKRDARDGVYKLMEVNARHNLSGMLAVRCGVDFPWLQYRHQLYGETPAQPDFADGVYWIDAPRDIGYSVMNIGREGVSLGDFLRPYRHRNVFAIASAKDPGPLLKRLRRLAVGGVKGSRRP